MIWSMKHVLDIQNFEGDIKDTGYKDTWNKLLKL